MNQCLSFYAFTCMLLTSLCLAHTFTDHLPGSTDGLNLTDDPRNAVSVVRYRSNTGIQMHKVVTTGFYTATTHQFHHGTLSHNRGVH